MFTFETGLESPVNYLIAVEKQLGCGEEQCLHSKLTWIITAFYKSIFFPLYTTVKLFFCFLNFKIAKKQQQQKEVNPKKGMKRSN